MTDPRAVVASDARYDLAEGIVWDSRSALVRWVDIREGQALSASLDGDRLVDTVGVDLGQTTGAVALAEDGGLLLAAARCLATVSTDHRISFGPDLLGGRTGVRFNDGAVDPAGRFVVGTLALGEETGREMLLRISPDGLIEHLRVGIRLSNGVAFSPDGATIYHVDTLAGTVSRHTYGDGSFDPEEPWVTVIEGFPHHPDGLTVDAEGMLWVAQWGGSGVLRFAPSGELLDSVAVGGIQASCPGFVGPDLDRLAIATAREGLADITDDSGAIFIADVGVSGIPVSRWAGSTSAPYWHEEKEHHA